MRSLPILIALVLASSVESSEAQPGPPGLLQEIRIDQRLDERLPLNLVFRDSEGEARPLGERMSGRPALVVPVYYECPMLCGEALRGLVGALKALPFEVGLDFDVFVVSFDPGEGPELAASERDEVLELYGKRGSASGWHFLTGDDSTVRGLTEAIGFQYVYDPESDLFAHASVVVVLTPDGRISRYFFGIDYAPRDLRLALVEASEGRIGGMVDALLLYCYHYDPRSGKYGVVILNVLRLAGAATVTLLGGFMLLGFRRDWRRASRAKRI
jgi:protein SCO1/2